MKLQSFVIAEFLRERDLESALNTLTNYFELEPIYISSLWRAPTWQVGRASLLLETRAREYVWSSWAGFYSINKFGAYYPKLFVWTENETAGLSDAPSD